VVTGEALAGDLDGPAADVGAPTQRAFAMGSAPTTSPYAASPYAASPYAASPYAASPYAAASAAAEARALALALSTTGGAVDQLLNTSSFGLTSPLASARDREGHRRLRRGKQQRRRNTPAVGTAVQPRLFKL
jgi:hypothetical protein